MAAKAIRESMTGMDRFFSITVIAQFAAQASEVLSSRASRDPWYLGQKKLKPQAINTWVVRSTYHFCKVNYFMHKV